MVSGDGLVVRVRLHGGRLPADVALRLAELSERFGNGLIDLSARGNLQLRGVSEAGHAALLAGLAALGLVDESAEAEAMRNVLVTPFWEAGDGAQEIATELVARLGEFPSLPGKFGYAVDTGAVPVLRGASADVRIERGAGGLVVRAEGMAAEGSVIAEQPLLLQTLEGIGVGDQVLLQVIDRRTGEGREAAAAGLDAMAAAGGLQILVGGVIEHGGGRIPGHGGRDVG